jgi:hypothetical protein
MEAQLQKTYARLRAENPTLGALNAIRWARGELRNAEKMRALGLPRYAPFNAERVEFSEGYALEFRAESDEFSEFADRSMLRIEWTRNGRPFPEAPECWIDRNGITQWSGDRVYDWARVESDYPLAERVANNRKLGMSRHNAWIAARESLARDFAFWREYWHSMECWLTLSVSLCGPDGKEIATDCIGGVESSGDYWRECLLDLCENVIHEWRADTAGKIAAARFNVRRDREHARQLVQEIRALAAVAGSAPTACNVLRQHVLTVADSVRRACGMIGRAQRALRAIEPLMTAGE